MDTLSGGNQQKVVLARWLLGEGRVLILDEPFQGVDIRARREIGARIRASAAGRATLVICTDPDEALEIADRILVVRDGAVVGGHANDGLQRADLVAQLAGVPAHPFPTTRIAKEPRVPESSSPSTFTPPLGRRCCAWPSTTACCWCWG